jgi:flavin-dependent dehydrogenase
LNSHYDAVIAGGGLAGLSLARQLRLESPSLRVLVLEKRRHPVPEAAFKVGESTVEIGAHYFQKVLALEPVLRSEHLLKFGLRYFFPNGRNTDLSRRVELGPHRSSPVPSFQIDRGRFENALMRAVRASGTEVLDGCSVHGIELGTRFHRVRLSTAGAPREVTAHWVVDASGRAGLLRRQLGLGRSVSHSANACWFRVNTRVRVDDWSNDSAWRQRVADGQRWLSTNHLMGTGYWVWLIPLGSGSTSFGIVADASIHPFSRINRFERALQWLRTFEPQCAAAVEAHASGLQDFLALQNYAYGSTRVFSPERWALTGEAGVFTDPFYSPGSDFIAIGNDCIADLIARERRGEEVGARTETFNRLFLRLFVSFLRLYDNQYRVMGNAQVMTAKIAWDNACYWAVTALLFFQRRYRVPEFLDAIEPLLRNFAVLHARMQQLFGAWAAAEGGSAGADLCLDVAEVEPLRRLQEGLNDPAMSDRSLQARLERNFALLEALAVTWQTIAVSIEPTLGQFVTAKPGGPLLNVQPLLLHAHSSTSCGVRSTGQSRSGD